MNAANEFEVPLPTTSNSSADDNDMLPVPFNDNDPVFASFNLQHYQPLSSSCSGPNAPPPSTCGTSSDHSGSACPSPGPMKRFRQIYGDQVGTTAATGSQTQIVGNGGRKAAMNWTENWMHTHYQFSKPSTSATPSVISNGSSVVSKLSAITVDTQLSVAIDFLNMERLEIVPALQFPISSGSSSFMENVNPCYFQQMRDLLNQIIHKLNIMDENQEFDALCQLYRIGKDQQFIYCSESTQMAQIIQRLVEIVLRRNTKQRTKTLALNVLNKVVMAGNVCMAAIRSLETADRGFFLNTIILCLRSGVEDDSRFATNILSALFSHQVMGEFFRRQARTQAVIRELMLALQMERYGFRYKFLRHIHLLIKNSGELKRFFHLSNGMQICLEIFQRSVEEPMLYGCALLILLLIDGLDRTVADHFVALKGIQILGSRLDHGSPLLLQCIAQCLAGVSSDSDEIGQQCIDDAIRRCIQLLASTDADLVKHVVGFIANVQRRHRGAKEFLQRNRAIPNLMFPLSAWANSIPSFSTGGHNCEMEKSAAKHLMVQKKGIDDIIDTILLALNNLSNGVNADTVITCQAIMEWNFEFVNAPSLFLQLLASPTRPKIIYNRTLYLLERILSPPLGPVMLERFMYVRTSTEGQQQKTYTQVLLELFFSSCSIVCSGQKFDKEIKTTALRSLNVLSILIKNQFFLAETVAVMRDYQRISNYNWNPFMVLRSMNDDIELESAYLEFLLLLTANSELATQWALYEEIANNPRLAEFATKIYNRMYKFTVNNNNGTTNNNAVNVVNTGCSRKE